jgi:hypothetical protein
MQAEKDSIEAAGEQSVGDPSSNTENIKTHDIKLSSTRDAKEWNVPECKMSAERQANMLVAGLLREVELAKSLMSVSPRKGRVDQLSATPGPIPLRHWCMSKVAPRQLRAVRTYLTMYIDRHGSLPRGELSFEATVEGDLIMREAETERYVFRADEY